MAACDLPVVSTVCSLPGNAASGLGDVAAAPFKAAVDALAAGFGKAFGMALTFWTKVHLPGLSDNTGPVGDLRSSLHWLTALVAVGSLLVAAIRLAARRHSEPASAAFRGLLTMLVVGGAITPGVVAVTVAGDSFSSWILSRSTGGNLGSRLGGVAAAMNPLGAGLVFIVAVLGILASLVQIFLMLMRIAVVVLLTGAMQTFAAGAGTPHGRQTFDKALAWLVAFALYQPAAAVIYASGFFLIGDGKDPLSVLSGLTLLIVAILALPALLRLLTPAVAHATERTGAYGAARQAGGDVASGARSVGKLSRRSGSSSGGQSEASGSPTGARPTGGTSAGPPPAGSAAPAAGGAGSTAAGGGAAAGAGAGAGVAAKAAGKAQQAAQGAAQNGGLDT
jgi:type IV secretion system protein TrbL